MMRFERSIEVLETKAKGLREYARKQRSQAHHYLPSSVEYGNYDDRADAADFDARELEEAAEKLREFG